jgi:hypothetical protein
MLEQSLLTPDAPPALVDGPIAFPMRQDQQQQQEQGGESSGSSIGSSSSVAEADRQMLQRQFDQSGPGVGPPNLTEAMRITVSIKACASWRQVQALVLEYASSLNALHISAALTHVAQLEQRRQEAAARQQPQQQPQQQEQQLQGGEAAALAAFADDLVALADRHMAAMRTRQAANMLWAVASLSRRADMAGWRPADAFVRRLIGACDHRSAHPPQLAMSAWALGALGVAPDAEWADALLARVRDHMQSFKPSDHARLVWGLAALGITPGAEWLDHLAAAVGGQVSAARRAAAVAEQRRQRQRVQDAQMLRQRRQDEENERRLRAAAAGASDAPSAAEHSHPHAKPARAGRKDGHQQQQDDKGDLEAELRQQRERREAAAAADGDGSGSGESAGAAAEQWARPPPQFSAQDVQMVLHSLVRWGARAAPATQKMLRPLLSAAGMVMGSFDGQALSVLAWCLATLGHRPEYTWCALFLERVRAAAPAMSPQSLSNTLWALAALGVRPSERCMETLSSAAASRAGRMAPQALSNTLWALAVLDYMPPARDLEALLESSEAALPAMSAQALSNSLWASARLGLAPHGAWVGALVAQVTARDAEQSAQGLVNGVWALSRLGRGDDDPAVAQLLKRCTDLLLRQLAALDRAGGGGGRAAFGGGGGIDAAGRGEPVAVGTAEAAEAQQQAAEAFRAAARESGGLTAAEMAALLHTLALGQRKRQQPDAGCSVPQHQHGLGSVSLPVSVCTSYDGAADAAGATEPPSPAAHDAAAPRRLLPLLLQATERALPAAGAQDLAVILRTLVDLGHRPGRRFMRAWLVRSHALFAEALPIDLSHWLMALGRLRFRPPPGWLASFQVATYRRMSRFKPLDMSTTIWACGQLRLSPEPLWLQAALREAARAAPELPPQQLANLVWGLARMRQRPPEPWVSGYCEVAYRQLPNFAPHELSYTLWGLANLNSHVDKEWLSEAMAQVEGQLAADEALFSDDVWHPNQVARALWALSRLKAEPDAAFVAACLRHCFSRARRLSATAICRLLWAIGNVQGWTPPRAWVARALAATHARIGAFRGDQLTVLATSLARLEHRPSDAWLGTFAAAAQAEMGGCDGRVSLLCFVGGRPSAVCVCAVSELSASHCARCTSSHPHPYVKTPPPPPPTPRRSATCCGPSRPSTIAPTPPG